MVVFLLLGWFGHHLDNVAVGEFIEQGALGDMPKMRQRIFDIGRLLVEDSEAGAKFREALVKYHLEPGADSEKQNKAATRTEISEERRRQFLNSRRADAGWPYYVQAVLELGTYAFSYGFMENCTYLTQQEMLQWQTDNVSSAVEYPEYAIRYNGKMMADFLKNLNTTKKKMVFVYGGNDPWTGAAIPNSVTSNPNVKKFIIPHGTHNDDILSEKNWESKGEEIIDAINAFLNEMKK